LELFRGICDAINYAHQRGVIHRDLKPTNIVIDSDDRPKVLDFGLARISDPETAHSVSGVEIGRLMGTLPYMSPEAARGDVDEIDVRCDVYSLGVILYELLTGEFPYNVSGTALPEAVRVICEEPPRRPSAANRGIQRDLETVVLTALQKERTRRYQSVALLAEDVRRYLSDQPIQARPASMGYRLQKLISRHRFAFFASAAVALVVAGAWVWVLLVERQLSAVNQLTNDNADLRVAIMAFNLADAQRAIGNVDRAEGNYREALAAFRHLNRNDAKHMGQTLLALATVLLERNDRSTADEQEARKFMEDANAIFRWSGPEWEDELRRTDEWLAELALRSRLETDKRPDEIFSETGRDDVPAVALPKP
jgi:hypothetical protein